MRYVNIEPTDNGLSSRLTTGYSIDASAYRAQLPALAALLPTGKRLFVTEPGHYDFNSQRFIKNLNPQRLSAGESHGDRWLELELHHNCWRHDEDLRIRYLGVRSLVVQARGKPDADVTDLDAVLIDEVLPHEHGCSHEIACLRGSLAVVCADLVATWAWAECPERPSRT